MGSTHPVFFSANATSAKGCFLALPNKNIRTGLQTTVLGLNIYTELWNSILPAKEATGLMKAFLTSQEGERRKNGFYCLFWIIFHLFVIFLPAAL